MGRRRPLAARGRRPEGRRPHPRPSGISVNRWEPANVVKALRTGLIDAVQVVYNIFDQAPEDELFPVCQELGVAVIARVPFDEGSLTGTMTLDDTWPREDWRNLYFTPENLRETLARVDARAGRRAGRAWTCRNWPCGSSCTIPAVSTVIPGHAFGAHTSSATWRRATAGRSRPTCWPRCAGTGGTGRR